MKKPVILHWGANHYVILRELSRKKAYIADPARGLRSVGISEFIEESFDGNNFCKVLKVALQTGETYTSVLQDSPAENFLKGLSYVAHYMRSRLLLYFPIILGTILTIIVTMVFPVTTQLVIDAGVVQKSKSLLSLIIIAQLMFHVGSILVNAMKNKLMLFVGASAGISMTEDFLKNLLKVNVAFLEKRTSGDLFQRIKDHKIIETFLTSTLVNLSFSVLTLIGLVLVLLFYDRTVLVVVIMGSVGSIIWMTFFLRRRHDINYRQFIQNSKINSFVFQCLQGHMEVLLANAQNSVREKWSLLQEELLETRLKNLNIEQAQSIGVNLVNNLKNIIITFWTASQVINGSMTLGTMFAIMLVVGQMNAPLLNLVVLSYSIQDSKISLDRILELREESNKSTNLDIADSITECLEFSSIYVREVSFRYGGTRDSWAIRDLDFAIPSGKVTSIVGPSGSGKSTFIKVLLGFYAPTHGEILLDETPIKDISMASWRDQVGAVLQEGYIFSDTIESNISLGATHVEPEHLSRILGFANLSGLIENLPQGVRTVVGSEGLNLSEGQRQRLLLARALYKNPSLLILDEATSALDTVNEKSIMCNIREYCKSKTMVIVAHRLSTVRHSDHIIVLEDGRQVEQGSHSELLSLRGSYYKLVSNQLECEVAT